MTETKWIDELSDAAAIDLLKRFAAGNQRGVAVAMLTPEVCDALATASDVPPERSTGTSEGELSRTLLQLLASSDATIAETLHALHTGPQPAALGFAGTVTVITAAIIALQTKVKFEADHTGKWSIKFDKGALNDNLLTQVIGKLFALAGA